MKPILERYIEKQIDINVTHPIRNDTMVLFLVADDYFGVLDPESGMRAYFPFTAVLAVYETPDNMLTVNLNHFVMYS